MCELEANLMCARCRSFFFFLDFFLEDYMWLDVRWVDEKGRLSRAESSLGGEAFQLRAKELLFDICLISDIWESKVYVLINLQRSFPLFWTSNECVILLKDFAHVYNLGSYKKRGPWLGCKQILYSSGVESKSVMKLYPRRCKNLQHFFWIAKPSPQHPHLPIPISDSPILRRQASLIWSTFVCQSWVFVAKIFK